MVDSPHDKSSGAYYTPLPVVDVLTRWASDSPASGPTLDPSCGDGRFLKTLRNSVGVDQDATAVEAARASSPLSRFISSDFFEWADKTTERFSAVVGNPPFIRYQRFTGAVRARSQQLAAKQGVKLSGLASSWASFVVGAAGLLNPGGRLAFVVPAEIAHVVYARPVVEYLVNSFGSVRVIAVREKLFPELSEDCWLLMCDGFGGRASGVGLELREALLAPRSLRQYRFAERSQLRQMQWKLRPFILSDDELTNYLRLASRAGVYRLGSLVKLGIGYVTGANSFFHLRPSEAQQLGLPKHLLRPAVRAGKNLKVDVLSEEVVSSWLSNDQECLLLDLSSEVELRPEVSAYLNSAAGQKAQSTYKCRNRTPWWVVPDVAVPDAFISLMSTTTPRLVLNQARCVCTNSVQALFITGEFSAEEIAESWRSQLTELSCEIEGHALGAGMLKVEPKEARRVLLPVRYSLSEDELALVASATTTMRRWRLPDYG